MIAEFGRPAAEEVSQFRAAPIDSSRGQVPGWLGDDLIPPPPAVDANGGFDGERLYHAVRVMRRTVEQADPARGRPARVGYHYEVIVVASDGAVLRPVTLPAPAAAPASARVIALDDGTLLTREPKPGEDSRWSTSSIGAFVAARQSGRKPPHPPLLHLLATIETRLRAAIWLPHDDYVLLALVAALSYVQEAFDALPIVLAVGARGSGKSEMGRAMAEVGRNGVVIGETSAATASRIIDKVRGLVVLDDLEKVRPTPGGVFNDTAQLLKLSYKKTTARREVTDARSMRTETLDLFGCKIISNTSGTDDVLGSRILKVRTARPPADYTAAAAIDDDVGELAALRDGLHTWAMVRIREVAEAARAAPRPTSRLDEIATPLRVLAGLAGEDYPQRLERCLARQAPQPILSPDEHLQRAMRRLVAAGAREEVALLEVRLELDRGLAEAGLTSAAPPWREPRWLGKRLRELGLVTVGAEGVRRRVAGVQTRVVPVDAGFAASVAGGNPANADPSAEMQEAGRTDPLAFCAGCVGCPYEHVCPSRESSRPLRPSPKRGRRARIRRPRNGRPKRTGA